jgi:hypothetical protein
MNESTSFETDKAADTITEELIPKKSRNIYEQQCEGFVKWCKYGETSGNLFLLYVSRNLKCHFQTYKLFVLFVLKY